MKALSGLAAALILIMLVAASSLLVYLWLVEFTMSAGAMPLGPLPLLEVKALALYTSKKTALLRAWVCNVGSTAISTSLVSKRTTIYIYEADTGVLVAAILEVSVKEAGTLKNNLIEPGEVAIIEARIPPNKIKPGKVYNVKLVILGVEYNYPDVKVQTLT